MLSEERRADLRARLCALRSSDGCSVAAARRFATLDAPNRTANS
jgi:hypothetical protein